MKEQMRIELHNETEYTERISFQDIWTHASKLKHVGCRVAAITDRNSVDGIHMAEYEFKTNHLTFNDIEFIMQMLEKQKASTTDPAERQKIEEIEEKIRKIAF